MINTLAERTATVTSRQKMHVSRTCLLFEVEEEFLVEDEGHAADLFHLGLRRSVPVDEVGCDGDR